MPDDLTRWAEKCPKPAASLIGDTKVAVARVLQQSEVAELWSESGLDFDWRTRTQDLVDRLG